HLRVHRNHKGDGRACDRSRRRHAGHARISARHRQMAIEVDGEMLTEGAALVVVANMPVFPGKLVFTRDANPLDGLLEVCVITGDTKRALIVALLNLLHDGPAGKHRILRRRGRMVRIAPVSRCGPTLPPSPNVWNETLTVLPRALPVLVPPSAAR